MVEEDARANGWRCMALESRVKDSYVIQRLSTSSGNDDEDDEDDDDDSELVFVCTGIPI